METGFAFSVLARYDSRVNEVSGHSESNAEELFKLLQAPEVIPCH